MAFDSLSFLSFFASVFVIYWAMPWHRLRVFWLLAASVFFYASWSKELALLVTATSVMDYFLARGMDQADRPRWRKACLGISLGVNLGVLGYFKYMNFFLDSLRSALRAGGLEASIPTLDILVPFGISFYTFEAISYTIDVYRGRIRAEKSLPNFMLFILFFPHLVAGPIVRAYDFLPQAARAKRWSWFRISLGMQFFVLGLFKKLAIADRMSVFSDPVFADPTHMSGPAVWVGMIAFAIRIYCDFSGYSDMALGTAHLLGFKLTKNFDLPYFAPNISEFWRRWHISLSTWLRDYLFIPLGGSRGSTWNTCRNLMITMTLGGLWHGANWSYVLWGVAHGSLLIVHRLFRQLCQCTPILGRIMNTAPARVLSTSLTFLCVLLTWTLFQPSLRTSIAILRTMVRMPGGGEMDMHFEYWLVVCALMLVGHIVVRSGWWQHVWRRMPPSLAGAACAAVFLGALIMASPESKAFIYFQF